MTEAQENAILEQAKQIQERRNKESHERAISIKARAASADKFDDKELVYAAGARCICGAGFAYPEGCGGNHYWDCSDVLTHRAETGTKHSEILPFVSYEVNSERQPSANGATTRKA